MNDFVKGYLYGFTVCLAPWFVAILVLWVLEKT